MQLRIGGGIVSPPGRRISSHVDRGQSRSISIAAPTAISDVLAPPSTSAMASEARPRNLQTILSMIEGAKIVEDVLEKKREEFILLPIRKYGGPGKRCAAVYKDYQILC